ncbi:MAG: ABC transporter permease [Anaerolineales bacterium]
MNKTFWNISRRYLTRHLWQSVLMVVGITLGVAVVVAVDLANASASRAFDLSTESVVGRSTHQISGGPNGLGEQIYTRLRRAGVVNAAAPVVEAYVTSTQLGNIPLRLLGVDPFAEAPFRNYLGNVAGGDSASSGPAVGSLSAFLTQPGAVLISTDLAQRYGLQACEKPPDAGTQRASKCSLTLQLDGHQKSAFVAGLLKPSDALSQRALNGLILADISTAQEITGRLGKLDRIDLILPENPKEQQAAIGKIQALLPEGAVLQPVAARSGAVEQMTAAFRLNLTALSLLALIVGMFLIYNTMTFSVVQRRPMFGMLRCVGVTRREVFSLVLGEALIIGLLGSALGIVAGLIMGQAAVRMVTQTINDLFFVVTVRGVQIAPGSLIKGGIVGVFATLLSAAAPAWEAASVPPRAALSRSGLEHKARRAVKLAGGLGIATCLVGGAILLIPTHSLVVSFGGTFAVIIGFAMLAPMATGWLMRLATPLLGSVWGVLGRMAPRDVINSLSRTAVAVAALMVAVSVTIGVSLMVSSFRHTVQTWLGETLQGDVYISAPGLTANASSARIDPQVVQTVRNWPGVRRADVLRSVTVDSPNGPVHVAATDNPSIMNERLFISTVGERSSLQQRFANGGVLVSEPFANRLGIPTHLPAQGASLELRSDHGLQSFPILGVFYDYASTQGTVLMDLGTYQHLWDDRAITAISLRLQPGISADAVTQQLQAALAGGQNLLVRPNQALRHDVLVVFDRTFAITGALQLLATIVAFIGVLSALLSLELERQRELGILRAVGLTMRQLWNLVLLETGLMGWVAGLLSIPTGYVLALILVYIINRRSFGWTLQMQVGWAPFAQAMLVAVTAAVIAGLYPARRMSRMIPSEALRSE